MGAQHVTNPTSCKCIVVFGTKGGVGKTVVASNLAVGLAQELKKSVCLIDLDIMAMGDVSKMLNVSASRSIADLAPALKSAAQLPGPSAVKDGVFQLQDGALSEGALSLEEVVAPHSSGVHVVTYMSNPRQLGALDPKLLPPFLEALKRRYDYIVIDAGKGFTDLIVAALDQAHLMLMVVTPDIVTLYQTKLALGILEGLLFPASMVKIVLNRAESTGGVGSADVREALPCEIIAEIPSDGRTVGTSINEGRPLITAYRSTKVAEAYRHLIDTLATRQQLYLSTAQMPRHRVEDGVPADDSTKMWLSRATQEEPRSAQEAADDELIIVKQRIHDALVEELDLKKLDLSVIANKTQLKHLREKTERVINNLLTRETGGMLASREVRSRLVKEIADEALGLGSLEELLADPDITDILVNGKDEIYVERKGKLQLTNKRFISNDQVRTVIERIVAPIGRRIDEAMPMVDARLPDGSRVNAIIQPLSIRGPVLSIRKFARERYTIDDMIRFGTLNEPMAQFLHACVAGHKNIIISGGTGSGKTTFLNVLSSFIPQHERIITIEDAVELKLAQRHWLSLEARPPNVEGRGQVTVRDLFRNVLRMRPDRVIIGECRGDEALDMLQAMNTGHDGSLTTIHANSPTDVITRLDSMVLMSNIDLPIRVIREMIASAVHLIIHTARLSDGSRKITAVSAVTGREGDNVLITEIFRFRQTGLAPDGAVLGQFEPTGHAPMFVEELRVKGFELPASLFQVAAPTKQSP